MKTLQHISKMAHAWKKTVLRCMGRLSGKAALPFSFYIPFSLGANASWKRMPHFGRALVSSKSYRKSWQLFAFIKLGRTIYPLPRVQTCLSVCIVFRTLKCHGGYEAKILNKRMFVWHTNNKKKYQGRSTVSASEYQLSQWLVQSARASNITLSMLISVLVGHVKLKHFVCVGWELSVWLNQIEQ